MNAWFFPTISTNIVIQAPPSVVRSVFFDFSKYPDWNPFITSLKTTETASAGDKIEFVANGRPITSTVYENTPERFSWIGLMGSEWLLKGHHYYEFEPYGDLGPDGETTGCRFVQGENFSGILCLLFFLIRGAAEKGFEGMNKGLKERAEAVSSGEGRS
jgi:hypothetical protein